MSPRTKAQDGRLTGVQKASILLMSIEEDNAAKLFSMMNEDEIREISHSMSTLGPVKTDMIESLLSEFAAHIADTSPFVGNLQNTEKLLAKALGKDKVSGILEDITGPAGRTTWDKLGNVNEDVLAAYLKNEYPQTAALVLTKIRSMQAAKVLSVLPEEFALEVLQRMLTIEPVKKEVLMGLEKTLQAEFMSNLAKAKKHDQYEMVAEIFNNFDRTSEAKYMELLESRSPESAEKVRALMFTFDDLAKIDNAGIQVLLRSVDKDKLAIALKGASETLRNLFFSNMSERAAKILKEDMEAKGPVRMRDVDEAQMAIVTTAKDLSSKGDITIADESEEDQLVY